MAEVVPMPKLGFDMKEGTLVRRLKQLGDPVAKGEIIAEIETDKATIELEAYVGGVVKGWVADEGKLVPVGSPMVVIGAPDEVVDLAALTGAPAAPVAAPAVAPAAAAGAAPAGRLAASPVARKMASAAGLDLAQVAGSGPNGRIIKRDVASALGRAAAAPAAAPAAARPAALPPGTFPADQAVPLTKLRTIIARRMVESTQSVPAIYLTIEVDMAAAMDFRKQLNSLLPEESRVSVNDLVVKSAALALRQFPNLNSSFSGSQIIRHGRVNVGMAVAVEAGLLTVVARDADAKPLAQLAAEVKPMIARARDGKVQPADIEGSTFTVSNLGMYDIEHFTAIVNLPEAAILAVGAVKEVPVVRNGQVVPGTRMKMTCAADHRITDGAEAARFLQAVRKGLEEPVRLIV